VCVCVCVCVCVLVVIFDVTLPYLRTKAIQTFIKHCSLLFKSVS